MDELIARATLFIAQHGLWAGPIVGLLAFGESLAVVGLFIPATALMIAVGGLVGAGVVEPWWIIGWAVVGAAIGDWISYAIGRRIGPSAYRRWPLNRHRSMVARARLFFRRFGFLSIFAGRFLGPIRATIPLVAGVMEMDPRRFQLANITSAILWVPIMFAPGYFAVKTMGSVENVTEAHVLGIGAIVAIATIGGTVLGARFLGRASRRRRPRRAVVSGLDCNPGARSTLGSPPIRQICPAGSSTRPGCCAWHKPASSSPAVRPWKPCHSLAILRS